MQTPGTLYTLTAPSGAGKTTLASGLLSLPQVERSVSYTTRPIRPGEQQGVDYWFVTPSEFAERIKAGDFLEYALVHGYNYGTSKQQVAESLQAGNDVFLVIDWQGAQQVRKAAPEVVTIFVLPPSKEILRERLQSRQQDSPEVIEQRMAAAASEVAHYNEFDYLIMNDGLENALIDLQSIVRTHRLTLAKQQQRYTKLLAEWLGTR